MGVLVFLLVKNTGASSGSTVDDSLLVIFIGDDVSEDFRQWYQRQRTGWFSALPRPYETALLDPDGDPEPESCEPQDWNAPSGFPWGSHRYHPGAEFQMRSVFRAHGHQATYADGEIITSGVAAGSADFGEEATGVHREEDVHPFIRAAQLDGNPVEPAFLGIPSSGIPASLNRPLMVFGDHLREYMAVRPALPSGSPISEGVCQ